MWEVKVTVRSHAPAADRPTDNGPRVFRMLGPESLRMGMYFHAVEFIRKLFMFAETS